MSEERDIYCDNRRMNDLAYMWHSATEFLFSDSDFYDRPMSKVHSIVRRNISEFHDSPTAQYLYAPAVKVRARLHLQGYTREKCIALWGKEYARHLLRLEELKGHADHDFSNEIEAQRGLTFETWEAREEARNTDDMFRWGGLHLFNFADTFAELALHIDTYKPKAVWSDLSSFYADEFDPNLALHENLRRSPAEHEVDLIEAIGDVLILTEGPSDTRILSSAIQAMYPEYADMFSFVDFEEFKVEGGASPLTKMVRAFAGVRMSQRILALFDNDAAGHEQNSLLRRMKLPPNIRSMTLPDSAMARRYPTIGPEGLRAMNINGAACSIELFLGRSSLSGIEGQLHPVRWSSWNKNARRYQGELENKSSATDKFIAAMRSDETPAKLKAKFKDMNDLLTSIFRAFD